MLDDFQGTCWDKTKAIRDGFDATQSGFKRKAQFAEKVLQIGNPTQHDIGELRTLYETAFDPKAATYKKFQPTGGTERLKGSPGNELLNKSITSSSDTPFAGFIKAIKATDWVRQGHEHFAETSEGKCPYCQQELPDDFEKQISACFDGQYQEDISALRQFQEDYISDMQGFLDVLNGNLQDAFPKLDLTEYKTKLALLEKMIEINIQRITDKLKEPSSVVTLENVKTLRDEINVLIEGFNKQIQANNDIVGAKRQKQTECTRKVWELIAFTLQSDVSTYRLRRKTFDDEITALIKLVEDGASTNYTMTSEGDTYEAFVVRDGRFDFCGSLKEALAACPNADIVDLKGAAVLPGLMDTHQHLFSYARDLTKLNLSGARSLEELLELLRQKAASTPDGQWILGTGFDQERFDKKVLPTKEQLDQVSPRHPVILTRYCLHVNVANSLALKLGGICKGVVPPVAGTVEFDADGEPTGVLWDQAAADIIAQIPDPMASMEAKKDAVEAACHRLNAFGLTSVTTIQGKHCDLFEYTDVYQELADENRLTARVYLGFDELPGCNIRTGLGDDLIKFGFYKIYTDGSMGARSAFLKEPYSDAPNHIGVTNYTKEELEEKFFSAHSRNIQVGVHAIGDRSIEILLDALESVTAKHPNPNARVRLIHMSLLNPSLIERMSKLPVVVDIQPMFVSTNVRWSESRIGPERAKYHYCWRSLIDAGLTLTAGSDSPIETFDPMKGIYAIVTRQGMDGYPEEGWHPEQRVTVYEAVAMYTKNAAFASFEENRKGTIACGKLADFVLLDQDIFAVAPQAIKDIRVLKTYLGGRLVYEAPSE